MISKIRDIGWMKVIAISACMALVIMVAIFFLVKSKQDIPVNIISKDATITVDDYWYYPTGIEFSPESVNTIFSESVVNRNTLALFSFLQNRFRDMTYEEHMTAVTNFIFNEIEDRQQAAEMLELYRTYTEYQKNLSEEIGKWPQPHGYDDMISNLNELQEFRRKVFGAEVADMLFGVQVKRSEYDLRKEALIMQTDLDGDDKEKMLSQLRKDMWGNGADDIENRRKPFDRYNEKLRIYEKDLNVLSESERRRKIQEFREEFFSPEVVRRMGKADELLLKMRDRDKEYSREKSEILRDSSLDEEEKREKVRALQDKLYQGEADSLRRREAYRKAVDDYQKGE